MRKLLWLLLSVLVLTAPSLVWGAAQVQSTAVVWPTIQQAIDNSNPFDTIRIEGNLTYNENLVVAHSNPIMLWGGWDPAFLVNDPALFPTIIDPARDGYNLTVLGSSGVTPWVVLEGLIFTNSHISSSNHFTGAIHAEANGGDVWLDIGVDPFLGGGNTFEKFFTGDSPGVFFLNSLGSSQIFATFTGNTIAHNFGFGDNIKFRADGPIQVIIEANIIQDNHFDDSPGLSFFTDNGGSFTADLVNNLITNNTSIGGVGGAINVQANTGDNRLTSVNDTIYKNLAVQAGGVRIASFLTSNTMVSFTNSIVNLNTAKKDPNVLITGNIDFGAAGCDLGSVTKTAHKGTYFVKNNFNEDPKVLGYIIGKPYLNSKSKAIDKGKDTLFGTVTASTVSTLTHNIANIKKGDLVGRTLLFTNPADEYRVVKSNTVTGITFSTDFPVGQEPGVGSAFTILGAPGNDIEGRVRPLLTSDVGCSESIAFVTGTSDINGKLKDLYTGKTLMSGYVILESLNGGAGAVNEVLKATLDTTSGKFHLKNLPNGQYRLTPHVVGYDFAPMVVTVAGVDVTENFTGVSYLISGLVKDAATNNAINGAIPYLTVDDWQASKSENNGGFEFHAGPGNFLIFLQKVTSDGKKEFQFFPKTVEAFAAGINGVADGGDLNDLADAAQPWAALGMNVEDKIIVITHADGAKEIRTINGVGVGTLSLTPNLLAPIAAGDRYTIDPHGVVGDALANTGKGKIVVTDAAKPWGTTNIGGKLIIVFHADGTVEYSSVDSVTIGNPNTTINLAKNLDAAADAGDRFAILTNTFMGTATGGSINTIIDAAVSWGNSVLVGRPISFSRQTANGKVKETKIITGVDPATGTITVDKNFNVAPVAGNTYEVDLLNYDFVGQKVP